MRAISFSLMMVIFSVVAVMASSCTLVDNTGADTATQVNSDQGDNGTVNHHDVDVTVVGEEPPIRPVSDTPQANPDSGTVVPGMGNTDVSADGGIDINFDPPDATENEDGGSGTDNADAGDINIVNPDGGADGGVVAEDDPPTRHVVVSSDAPQVNHDQAVIPDAWMQAVEGENLVDGSVVILSRALVQECVLEDSDFYPCGPWVGTVSGNFDPRERLPDAHHREVAFRVWDEPNNPDNHYVTDVMVGLIRETYWDEQDVQRKVNELNPVEYRSSFLLLGSNYAGSQHFLGLTPEEKRENRVVLYEVWMYHAGESASFVLVTSFTVHLSYSTVFTRVGKLWWTRDDLGRPVMHFKIGPFEE